MRPLRPLVVLALVVVGLSGAFIATYRVWFRLPAAVVPAHVGLVAGGLAVAILAAVALQTAFPRRPRLVVLPIALAVGALALLDAVSWVARDLWVEELSLAMILFYAPRIWTVAAGATEVQGVALVAAVVGCGVVGLAAVLASARPLAGAVAHAATRLGPRPGVASAVALVGASALLVAGYRAVKDRDALRGEPLAGLFPGERSAPAGRAGAAVRVAALQDGRMATLARADAPAPVTVVPGRKNVIVVVIDSLRPDHVSSAGYRRTTTPALDAFVAAAPAVVADWATSACSISGCGIMAILASAQYARQRPGMVTLPDVVRAAGYETFFIGSGDFSRGYPVVRQAFGATRLFVDGFTERRWAPSDDRHVVDAVRRIPAYEGRPALFYFHLSSIHRGGTKYRAPQFRPALTDTGIFAALMGPGRRDGPVVDDLTPAVRVNDYDNSILQADEVLAEIVAALQARGWLDHAVVVVTSDHGETLGERGRWGHGDDLYAPAIDIPLVVRDATLGGSRRVPYATHVDVAPTVAACLGLAAPAEWEGRSLLDGVTTHSFHQTTHAQPILAVIWRTTRGTFKYLVDTKTRAESLYALDADPAEATDVLATTDPAIVAALRAALAENFATLLSPTAPPQ